MDEQTTEYTLSWTIQWDGTSPRDAAQRVWREVFGRVAATKEDACVFTVTDPATGQEVEIDLGDEEVSP